MLILIKKIILILITIIILILITIIIIMNSQTIFCVLLNLLGSSHQCVFAVFVSLFVIVVVGGLCRLFLTVLVVVVVVVIGGCRSFLSLFAVNLFVYIYLLLLLVSHCLSLSSIFASTPPCMPTMYCTLPHH